MNSQSQYFWTSSNYPSEGDGFETLPDGNELKNFSSLNKIGMDINSRLTFYGLINYSYSTSSATDFDRTNSGLSDIGMGAGLLLPLGPLKLIPELELSYPLTKVEQDTDEVMLSEGSMGVSIGSWAEMIFWNFITQGYLGYLYRDGGRSHLLEYQIGTSWRPGAFQLGGALGGFMPLTDDENINVPEERDDVTERVNAGSMKWYGVNPSLLEFNIYGGFEFHPDLLLQVGYGMSLNGHSAADGQHILVGLQWSFGGEEEEEEYEVDPSEDLTDHRSLTERNSMLRRAEQLKAKPKEKFVPEKPEYDQESFKEAEMEIQLKKNEPPPPKKKVKKRKKKKVPPQEDQLQN